MESTHTVTLGGNSFTLSSDYQHVGFVNLSLSYPTVRALHPVTGTSVFITKVRRPLVDLYSLRSVLRNLCILAFCDHSNIVTLVDIPRPPDMSDLYYVWEGMDAGLRAVIRSPQALSNTHSAYFLYQVLAALKYLHSTGIVLGTIETSTILVNQNCKVKLSDFSTAWKAGGSPPEPVERRENQAPEVLLNAPSQGRAGDMWTAGCVLAELLGRQPLFSAPCSLEHVRRLVEIVGSPSDEDMSCLSSQARKYLSSLPTSPAIAWITLFPSASPGLLELLGNLLVFNPAKRFTPAQCLELPCFQEFRFVEEEIEANRLFDWSFEEQMSTLEEAQRLITEAAQRFHPN